MVPRKDPPPSINGHQLKSAYLTPQNDVLSALPFSRELFIHQQERHPIRRQGSGQGRRNKIISIFSPSSLLVHTSSRSPVNGTRPLLLPPIVIDPSNPSIMANSPHGGQLKSVPGSGLRIPRFHTDFEGIGTFWPEICTNMTSSLPRPKL